MLFCRDILIQNTLKLEDGILHVFQPNFHLITNLFIDFLGRGDYIECFTLFMLSMPIMAQVERIELARKIEPFFAKMRVHIFEKMRITVCHKSNNGCSLILYDWHDLCELIIFYEFMKYYMTFEEFFEQFETIIVNYVFEYDSKYYVLKARVDGSDRKFQTIEFFYHFQDCVKDFYKLKRRLCNYVCNCSQCFNYLGLFETYMDKYFSFDTKFINHLKWN